MKNEQIFKIVTDKILDLLEQNETLTWVKSWTTPYQGIPRNFATGHEYRGFNRFIASLLFESPYFMTYKQITEKGGKVTKGAKGLPITYWNWLHLDETGKKINDYKGMSDDRVAESIPFLRYFTVFNEKDIEGIEFPKPDTTELPVVEKIEKCEQLVGRHNCLRIKHKDLSGAYYVPTLDYINILPIEHFNNAESYYCVLFHEMAHWTGHSTRLDRFKNERPAAFGSADYSQEELVAEMTASFLCEHTGISTEKLTENSAAYIKNWLGSLKSDPAMLVRAGTQAQKAFDYITQ